MMGTDGRDRAKCKKFMLGDMIEIIEMFNDNKTKVQIVIIFFLQKAKRKCGKGNEMHKVLFLFLVRESVTSL